MARSSASRQLIESLKRESPQGPRVQVDRQAGFRIWIPHRGEMLFYEETSPSASRALLLECDPSACVVALPAACRWDDGTLLSPDERATVRLRLVDYFLLHRDGKPVTIV